jgi:hypothetical protein
MNVNNSKFLSVLMIVIGIALFIASFSGSPTTTPSE